MFFFYFFYLQDVSSLTEESGAGMENEDVRQFFEKLECFKKETFF